MTKENLDKKWLTSKEVKSFAKIKSCDLMHHREAGKLEFKKKGNSFYYLKDSVEELNK